MSLFITVGSTGFDDLIHETTTNSFLSSLKSIGINKILYQYGSSETIFKDNLQDYQGSPLQIDGYKYKTSIAKDMESADIIISHAGAGTILQALRLNEKKLIMVVNKSLMDNHQFELAKAMEKNKYAICSEISEISDKLKQLSSFEFVTFPKAKKEIFGSLVDEQMGFIN